MWSILLGHILGDYFFQTKKMALTKTKDFDPCCTHCLIYAACVCFCAIPYTGLFSQGDQALFFGSIFLTHFLIDFFSLGQVWLRLIKGRTFDGVTDKWDMIFTAIVYVVVDNTLHILCVIGALWLLGATLWA